MVQYVTFPSRISITALKILSSDGWLLIGVSCVADDRYLLSKDVEPGWCLSGLTWPDRGIELLKLLGITLTGCKEG